MESDSLIIFIVFALFCCGCGKAIVNQNAKDTSGFPKEQSMGNLGVIKNADT
jgi:hypothetical protein